MTGDGEKCIENEPPAELSYVTTMNQEKTTKRNKPEKLVN